MNTELLRGWRRWMEADVDGRGDDGEADAAFRAVFCALPPHAPAPGFTDRVMNAVALAAARRARRIRIAVVAAAAVGVLGTLYIGLLLLRSGPRLLLGAVDLSLQAVLWIVGAAERGLDVWAILAQVGRVAGAVMVAPEVTIVLVALGLVAVGALYGLHRVLVPDQESYR